ncbi:unnamed protein product [Closterium sp. NIES-64]|nr:unnamed protein product [Closterium sp. NIES-64]
MDSQTDSTGVIAMAASQANGRGGALCLDLVDAADATGQGRLTPSSHSPFPFPKLNTLPPYTSHLFLSSMMEAAPLSTPSNFPSMMEAAVGVARYASEFLDLVDAADATGQADVAVRALRQLAGASLLEGALLPAVQRRVSLRLALHGEGTRLQVSSTPACYRYVCILEGALPDGGGNSAGGRAAASCAAEGFLEACRARRDEAAGAGQLPGASLLEILLNARYMQIQSLVRGGCGREAACAAALLGDANMLEKAWADTGMVPEAALHALSHGRPTLATLLKQWNRWLQKEEVQLKRHNMLHTAHFNTLFANTQASEDPFQTLAPTTKDPPIQIVPPREFSVAQTSEDGSLGGHVGPA